MSKFLKYLDDCFPKVCGVQVVGAWEQKRKTKPENYCWRCGITMPSQGITEMGCAFCKNKKFNWDGCYRLGNYQKPLKDWIWQLKYHKEGIWGNYFGRILGQHISSHQRFEKEQPRIVCPVPLHFIHRFARGFNQAKEIGNGLAKGIGCDCVDLLKRHRKTKKQATLRNLKERKENVRGAFKSRGANVTGSSIYLVDDVKTTGATINECAKILRQMGAMKIYAVVVATAEPRARDSPNAENPIPQKD